MMDKSSSPKDLITISSNNKIFFEDIKKSMIDVIEEETKTLQNLITNFPNEVLILVDKILKSNGRVVFAGMGKSGLIARKIVSTFSSLGIPSIFIHPAEALHGDLGMIQPSDFFIALSKSGTGAELEQILPILASQGNDTALICCASGNLVKYTNLTILLPFTKEACEMNLAPTNSSTLMLALGDAMAITISKIQGFTKNDFAKFHPGGSLGKNLLLKVKNLMHESTNLPFINKDDSFQQILITITKKKLGVGIVIDANKKLLGIITDGDLRRACELGSLMFEKKAYEIMTPFPKTINTEMLAYQALIKMEKLNITSLIVTENDFVVGLIHIHDLVKAGITK